MKIFVALLVLVFFWPVAAEAGINLVQHVGKDAGASASSSLAFTSSNAAGNFIAVAVRSGRSGQTFAVSDSQGNTYRLAVTLNVTLDSPSGDTLAVYYAENIRGGANTVSIAQSLSSTLRFSILEYSGVASTNSLDRTASAQGSGSTASSGNLTTSAADLVLGAILSANERTFTAGSNFTVQDRVPAAPNTKLITENWIQAASGAGAATASLSSSDIWGAVVATFRPSTNASQPDLSVSKTHNGSFTQGQSGAIYTLTVSNIGTGPTTGTVTMTDALPAGLTATALAGPGWNCSLASVSCTRSDVLQAGTGYPAITLSVNVAANAAANLTNVASVSGGGDSNSANNSASDVTSIGTSADTQAPTTPGNLNATAAGGSQINLAWDASTDNTGVAAYRVERCQGTGCSSFSEIGTQSSGPITGPLSASANPNYFKDAAGTPIVLSGSQTWNSLQDWGANGSMQTLDFTAFVNFLSAHGHNFTLLWRTELPKFCGLPSTTSSPPDFTVGPHPWRRTGPGTATDGGPKFDLTQFDQNYFDRLRARVQALNTANIYAGVYLFTGEWLAAFRCPDDGYPFSAANNINGIDDGGGIGSMTMTSPNALTSFQDAYVQKVIDTLNDMPNVLWIVSEEAPSNTDWWHSHQISLIHTYESGKPYRHPVGYAVRSDFNDATLLNSDADWIAPGARISPTASCGSATPPCKVNINDSDHSYFGIWNDTAQANRNYAWQNFTNGNQVLFMDPYSVYYPRENRNLCLSPVNGICSVPDTRWDNFRNNLGAIVSYSRRLNLANVTPQSAVCSTSNCLAQTPSVGAEYLIYSPDGGPFTVNLSAMSSSRTLAVEWFNPSTGAVISAASVPAGSSSQSFTPPFTGDAVLYLVDSAGHAAQQSSTTGTSFSDTGLQSGQSYSYRVRSADTAGNLSSYSNIASAATSSSDSTPPTAPSGVIATTVSSSQIDLTWTASTDNIGVTAYLLERCQGSGCTTFTALPAQVSTPGYSDSNLLTATSYSYRLRGRDAAGNLSPYSGVVSATTSGTSTSSAISLVQHQGRDAGTTVSTSLAFGTNNAAGNFIAVAIRSGRSGQTFTVSDSKGNIYRQAVALNVTLDSPSGDTLAIYYAENIGSGANTVTISQSLSASLRFAIFEYAGVAASNSLDRTASAQASGSSPSSGSVTTSAADLLLGAVMSASERAFAAGTNFTIRDRIPSSSGAKLITEDWIQTTAGSGAATASLSSSDVWGAVVAAFRPSTTSSTNVPPSQPDLKLTKSHLSSFVQGQTGAVYTLTASNIGAGPTSGTVTMTDTLPSGLAATALTGTGWNCSLASISCTRSDVLQAGSSYPAITLTVDVSATAPSSVTNTASISGGGDSNSANNSASDITSIGASADTQSPTAPGTLSGSAPDGSHVNLTWLPATDNVAVADYRVERCDGTCTVSGGGFVKRVTLTTTSFSDSGLTPSTTYSYVVRAEDAANNLGPYSNVVTLTTPATVPELVIAFSFDEASGTTVSDSSGKGNNGNIINATRSAGKYGNALSFNGTNAKVSVPDTSTLHLTTAMTLEAWVNPSVVTSEWRDIIEKGNDNYFLMGTSSSNGAPGAGGFLGGMNITTVGTSPLPTNTWSHLAATYDGATLRLYVNAVEVSNASRAGSMTTSTSPLEIGGDSLFGQYFQGLIDELRIYNTARTPSQIQSDMNSPIGSSFPIASLSTNNLDFGSVSTGSTSSPQSVTMTNLGGVALAISGISVTGTNSSEFSQTSNCGSSLAANASCSVSLTFIPGNTGARNASLQIDDNAAGSPHLVTLTGTGLGYSITPRISVLTPTMSQQFGVTGGSGGGIQWAVDGVPGGSANTGTISASGLYSPPLAMGTHTVTATNQSLVSNATVYVTTYSGTLTHHNDNARTGQNLNETVLTPSNVNPSTFGKLMSYDLDGLSIASPLYVAGVTFPGGGIHNVVYVATEHDSVYAFDADGSSSAPLWKTSFLVGGATTVPAADTGECCDIAPEIGITGTPVIDAATRTLYVVAKTKEGSGYFQRLHALDIATGAEKSGGWPITIQANVPGSGQGSSGGQVSFNALRQNQRPALLLSNGIVYVAFGAHGDIQPYHGWVFGYNVSTLQQTMAVNLSPNADGGGIWQANGGPAADVAGNIYVITGNGGFSANSVNGKDYGDSFVKISTSGTILDYFTPYDQANINSADFDLGAAGPLLLPDQPGAHPHLMVSAGKNNTIYLVDRDNMGHISTSNNDSQIVQSLINIFPHGTPEPGNYSGAVYFNGNVFFGPIADNIQVFQLANGRLSTSAVSRSQQVYKYPGATMAISANGSSNGLLWAIQRNGDCGVQLTCSSATPGVLRAYDAGSSGNTLVQVYSSDQMGTRDALDFATKFSVPLVANGKVFVASMTRLTIYGLLP